MTAGNHRVIIEKGADFKIEIQVSENGIVMKDVTGYSVEMVIKHDVEGVITVLDTIAGYLIDDVLAHTASVLATDVVLGEEYTIKVIGTTDFTALGATSNTVGEVFTATANGDAGSGTGEATYEVPASGTYLNGNVGVTIDKATTATYPTLVDASLNAFTTEYNYFYNIDLTEDIATSIAKDNIRILRGKAAVRV